MSEITKVTAIENKFLPFKAHITEIAKQIAAIEVTDEVSEGVATQIISKAAGYLKQIETTRKAAKEPSIAEGKAIDAMAKKFTEDFDKEVAIAKQKLLAYKQEVNRKLQEEQQKLQKLQMEMNAWGIKTKNAINTCDTKDELGDVYKTWIKGFDPTPFAELGVETVKTFIDGLKHYGSARMQMIMTPAKAEEIKEAQQEQEQKVMEEVQAAIEVKAAEIKIDATTGMRKTWTCEVIDEAKLPRNWMMPDDAKIKAAMKLMVEEGKLKPGDDTMMNGVRFYQKEGLVTR